ncbi:MAG: hypothetical protein Q7J04_06010, partial [Microcella sp.]|nr:hypothetical protein [Microcella sp.]
VERLVYTEDVGGSSPSGPTARTPRLSAVARSLTIVPFSIEQWWARRQRVTGLEVPYPIGRYRDAWAPFTALVEQFRPERNGELVLSQIPPAAEVYLVWVCSVGHEFVATPAEHRGRPGRSRSSRSWCPVCSTPSLLPSVPKWPRSPAASIPPPDPARFHDSGDARATDRPRMPARRATPPHRSPSRELLRPAAEVRPGEAFCSDRAPRATSAAEGRLRELIAERLDVDVSPSAVRVRTPFFGRLEVWPDVIIAELAIAIELDTVGRNADEHIGRRERTDRRKDQLLREVGWHVIRLRCRPLRALGPDDLVVAGVSATAVDALIDRMGEVRGHLFVQAYARTVGDARRTAPRAAPRTPR